MDNGLRAYVGTCGSSGAVGSAFKPGRAAAGDLGIYYKKQIKENVKWALGASVTNIGNKVTYSTSAEKDFLPANLRLGTSFNTKLDEHNELNINFDINKLLVPTYPVYFKTVDGIDSVDASGNKVVQAGKDSKDVPVITGMLRSLFA